MEPNAELVPLLRRAEAMLIFTGAGISSTSGIPDYRGPQGVWKTRQVECQTCGQRTAPTPHFEAFRQEGHAPACPCGGYLKSATISFGQSLREPDLARVS